MGGDARIDEELLFIRAVADIDELYIRVLARMKAAADRGVSRQNADYLRGVGPGLGTSVEALLATLQLHALIAEELGEPHGPFGYPRPFLVITGTGRRFLARLADDSDCRGPLPFRSGHIARSLTRPGVLGPRLAANKQPLRRFGG
jgi:hypothetical protein